MQIVAIKIKQCRKDEVNSELKPKLKPQSMSKVDPCATNSQCERYTNTFLAILTLGFPVE
jgi:hypothetical protein